MKNILIVLGILVAIILIAISGVFEFEEDEPIKSFTMGQGPGDDLVKSLSVSCSPDPGYDFCYENTYNGLTARIHSTEWIGDGGYGYIDGANRRYYIDEVYVNVKYYGDRLYRSSSTSWVSCTGSGCSATSISPGKQVLASSPAKVINPVQFVAWNKFTSTTGRWWYSYVQFGWLSPTNAYVIDCFDESDCGSNEYCDKSGAWDTWSCEIDPCLSMPTPENVCDGFDLWSQKCVYGDVVKDKIIETNSNECGCIVQEPVNTCIGFDLWSQKQAVSCVEGLTSDKIIQSNSPDCGCIVQDTPDVCVGFDMWSQKQSTMCVEGLENDQLIEEKSIECGYVCDEGETKSFKCTDDTNIVTQLCINNEWTDVDIKSCPLNWINLESILNGYLDEIKEYLEKLL